MKILFFSWGDPNLKSTWSNVPYCFCKALEHNGHEVIKVNLSQYRRLEYYWNRFMLRIIKRFYKEAQYDFFRSILLDKLVNHHISSIIKMNSDADLCIFTTFSFFNKKKTIPSLLFCDWSYETYLERMNHKPYFFEKWFIKRERFVLMNATSVVSLFPECSAHINQQLGKEIVKWGGVSAPNILDENDFNADQILKSKLDSNIILFIGGAKYLDGAKLLVKSFNNIKKHYPDLELHIIGMKENLFQDICSLERIFFHGYLNKDDNLQCQLYYDLLKKSAIFCNPTQIWAGFSSTIEAMYYFTPVIVSPYEDFTFQFGKDIEFGYYITQFQSKELENHLKTFFDLKRDDRKKLCLESHRMVKDLHWNEYVLRILKFLEV